MFYVAIFVAGFVNLFTPGAIVFTFFILALPTLGVFLKKKILIYISFLLIAFVFFFYLTIPIPFIVPYIGPVTGVVILQEDYLLKLILNSGYMLLPLIVSLVSLKLLNRKSN